MTGVLGAMLVILWVSLAVSWPVAAWLELRRGAVYVVESVEVGAYQSTIDLRADDGRTLSASLVGPIFYRPGERVRVRVGEGGGLRSWWSRRRSSARGRGRGWVREPMSGDSKDR